MRLLSNLLQFSQLIRLPNSFTVISNVLAAHVIGNAGQVSFSVFLLTLTSSLLLYHGGMVLNDCFDYQQDAEDRPNRPLPSGFISFNRACWLAGGMLFLGALVLLQINYLSFMLGIVLLLSIVLYNALDRRSILGCFVMGLCRVLNWCVALAAVGALAKHWPLALVVGFYVTGLTFISRDEIEANRLWLVYLCGGFILLGTVLLTVYVFANTEMPWVTLSLLSLFILYIAVRLVQLLANYHSEQIQALVMFFVLGLIPLDAMLTLSAGYPLFSVIVLVLIVPARMLARRLYVT